MGLKAKISTILRITGSILILIGLCLSLFFKTLFINDIIEAVLWIFIILPWILSFILLKLSIDFVRNNFKAVLFLLIILSSMIFFIVTIMNLSNAIIFGLNLCLVLLLLNTWYFSLSIFKKRKILFLLSGIIYILGTIILDMQIKFLGDILTIIIVSLGMIMILIIEYNMRKKGYLNYV